MQVFNWLFKAPQATTPGTAAVTAKDRMRNMLTHDRLELPAGKLEVLEEELTAVVARYFDLEPDTTRFDLKQIDRKAALIANFQLVRSKC